MYSSLNDTSKASISEESSDALCKNVDIGIHAYGKLFKVVPSYPGSSGLSVYIVQPLLLILILHTSLSYLTGTI